MPSAVLDNDFVDSLSTDKRVEYSDPETPVPLGLRVEPSGRKVYFTRYRLRGERKRQTLGPRTPTYGRLEALIDASNFHQALRRGELVEKKPTTVNQLLDLYLAVAKPGTGDKRELSDEEWRGRRGAFKNHVRPDFGERKVYDLATWELDELLGRLARVKPRMANRVCTALKVSFAWGMRKGHITHNPTAELERPARENKRHVHALGAELASLYSCLKSEAFRSRESAVLLLHLLGQRKTETRLMNANNIHDGWWLLYPKDTKTKTPHRVWLPRIARQVIDHWSADLPREGFRPAIMGMMGGTVGALQIFRHWGKIRDLLGLQHLTQHDLRRTVITGLHELGCPDDVAMLCVNHKSGGAHARYNHAKKLQLRQEWMEAWFAHLEEISSNVEVIRPASGHRPT